MGKALRLLPNLTTLELDYNYLGSERARELIHAGARSGSMEVCKWLLDRVAYVQEAIIDGGYPHAFIAEVMATTRGHHQIATSCGHHQIGLRSGG
jgi:hypothetical protein